MLSKLFDLSPSPGTEKKEVINAITMLFAEVIRADFKIETADLKVTRRILMECHGIEDKEASQLIDQALSIEKRPTSYHPYTKTLNQNLSYSEKVTLIHSFWQIALADKTVDKYEDHVIRKFADLLHVSHKDFISKKNLSIRGANFD